jgi:translation initiation factor 1
MSGRKKRRIGDSGDIRLGSREEFSLSIGDALGRGGRSAAVGPRAEPDVISRSGSMDMPAEDFLRAVVQATLHRETAGRGGRTVTALSCKPAPDSAAASELAKVMRKGLGCGAHVEGSRIILHGDIKDRARDWLTRRGVRRVVLGN